MRLKSLIFVIFILASTIVTISWAAEAYDVVHLVQVRMQGLQDYNKLQELDLDIARADVPGYAELIATHFDLMKLDKAGFSFEVKITDLAAFNELRLSSDPALENRDWPDGSMGGYFTNSEMEAELDAWAVQYPDIISAKTSIGTTIQGRDIWAVKISDNPDVDEDEPEACFDSLIHPREVMSMMTVVYYMKQLLEGYGTDPELTYLVDNREIWFIPIHNPDGHVYNESTNPGGGGLWRKNRRNNGGGVYGVDLARNYSFKWGYDNVGSSPNPSSIAYRGTGPFSEPESQAVSNFLTSRPIVTGWNTHTFTNVYICPFCYDDVLPYGDDWAHFKDCLTDISDENGYPVGPSPDTLGYYANGTPLDWQYDEQGIFCLAPEIGTWDDYFWPPKSRIVPLAQENQLAITYWTWLAGSYVRLDGHTLSDANGDGFYHPGEPVEIVLDLRNKGFADTVTTVTATLSSSSPFVHVTGGTHDFGTIPGITSADNSGNPLKFIIDSSTSYGEVIPFDVTLSFDGASLTWPMNLVCGVPEVLYAFDMETAPGWTVGDTGDNATTGIWTLGNPMGVMAGTQQSQPEDDHTPSPGTRCFVTGNGTTQPDVDDVDNGKTTLKTAIFDLSGKNEAQISYWRWYADLGAFFSNNDTFQVDISNNGGGTWTHVELLEHTVDEWEEVIFKASDFIPLTSQMMMRFIARDEPDDSLCEALIDDFVVKTYSLPLQLSLLGTPQLGSTVNFELDAPSDSGLGYFMAASLYSFPVVPAGDRAFPLAYDFILTPISITPGNGVFNNFYGYLDGAGYSADPEFNIPYMPILVGVDIFFAAATLDVAYPEGLKNISAPLPITVE